MKQGLEGRLRKLESEYQAALDPAPVSRVLWLTADEIERGVQPGVYDLSPEEIDSRVTSRRG